MCKTHTHTHIFSFQVLSPKHKVNFLFHTVEFSLSKAFFFNSFRKTTMFQAQVGYSSGTEASVDALYSVLVYYPLWNRTIGWIALKCIHSLKMKCHNFDDPLTFHWVLIIKRQHGNTLSHVSMLALSVYLFSCEILFHKEKFSFSLFNCYSCISSQHQIHSVHEPAEHYWHTAV